MLGGQSSHALHWLAVGSGKWVISSDYRFLICKPSQMAIRPSLFPSLKHFSLSHNEKILLCLSYTFSITLKYSKNLKSP